MDAARLKRYADKMELISKRITELGEWKADFLEDEKTMLASYKAFQEVVEASMDIVAMMAKDSGSVPKDDYTNIETIERKNILERKICDKLREANGLRNRVVHHYNGLSAARATESVERLLPVIEEFVEAVKKWLQRM
jgi:uncharacterized protein YutE (UPF0331/DUF86 family)